MVYSNSLMIKGMEMGFFDSFLGNKQDQPVSGVIDYGKNKAGGSHDHRTNRGNDRTPAQKAGNESRRKSSNDD